MKDTFIGLLAYLKAAVMTVPKHVYRAYKVLTHAVLSLTDITKIKQFHRAQRGQMGGRDLPSVAILVVIAGVVLFVGIQIMSQVVQNTSLDSGDPFYNATETLEQDFNNAFGTFGLAVTIVIFSVIIVYLYGLRGGGR